METLIRNLQWLQAFCCFFLFFLSLASASGTICNDWPALASYRLTDKEFTCEGIITAMKPCNVQYQNDETSTPLSTTLIGLILWRKDTGEQDIYLSTQYGLWSSPLLPELMYNRGDQLQYIIGDFLETARSDIPSCTVPLLVISTDLDMCRCKEGEAALCLNVTNDCFQDISQREADTAVATCTFSQTTAQTHPQCTLTVTTTHTIPETSLQPCADLPPSNNRCIKDVPQTSNPTICPGTVVAIVLGIVLIIQFMACTVTSVVCLKRGKERMKRGGKDGVICVEAETAENSAELCASASLNAQHMNEMTHQRPSVDSLPEAIKSNQGCYCTNSTMQEYIVPQSDVDYDLSKDLYWTPAATLTGIKAQMRQRKDYAFELQPDTITLLKELGKGEFGMIHRGEWAGSPCGPLQVAIKSLHRQEEESRYKLLKEAAIMGQFNHPYVVRLYGVIDRPNKAMLIMEYLSRGDLRNHLMKSRTGRVEKELALQLLRFCQEIADAMDYLSKKGFIHRDLAARNVLLNEEYTAKIADFGMSHDMDEDYYYKVKGGIIPVKWTAPEAILYRRYTTKSDVWSYGMVMHEIWSLGHKPFEEFNTNQVLRAFETRYCQPPPPGCPRNIYKLMVDCWNPDHHSRSSFEDLTRELGRDPEVLLSWREQDKTASPKAAVLGAPLEEGIHLYLELQDKYK